MENLIYGTLLGDGCISKDRGTPLIAINHCVAQLPYLVWKAKMLSIPRERIKTHTSGYGSEMYGIRYYNAKLLHNVYNVCHSRGDKQVNEEWISKLDELSLAVWYQDDGNWSSCGQKKDGRYLERYARFSTCAFDRKSHELLVKWLSSFGIKSRIRTYDNYPYIVLGQSATIRMWDIVAPYIVLQHKIDTDIRPGINWCECSAPMYQSNKECDVCLYDRAMNWTEPCSRNNPNYFKFAGLLATRFGTASLNKLRQNKPQFTVPNKYWIDISKIGLHTSI